MYKIQSQNDGSSANYLATLLCQRFIPTYYVHWYMIWREYRPLKFFRKISTNHHRCRFRVFNRASFSSSSSSLFILLYCFGVAAALHHRRALVFLRLMSLSLFLSLYVTYLQYNVLLLIIIYNMLYKLLC